MVHYHRLFLAWLLLICLALGILAAGNTTLPTAYFDVGNNTWMVTVPAEWNYATILHATNRFGIHTQSLGNIIIPDPNTMLQVYINGTYSGYATNALNYEFNGTAYSDDVWTLPVTCVWPISGMYSRLNRILYYLALVFALVVRHHEWLVAGALATATTYSGAAAVQAWVQFGVLNSKDPKDPLGDNDNEAIMGILAAGLLMAVPLINWSRTLRRLRTRPLLIYWAIIIFVGYLLVIIGEKKTEDTLSWAHGNAGIMTCNTTELLPHFKNLGFLDHTFMSTYNCDDPCYNPPISHPFHGTSSVVTRLACDIVTWKQRDERMPSYACFLQCPRDLADDCYVTHDGWGQKEYDVQLIAYYVILPIAIFELFFVLCFGRKSPEEIREQMFKFIVGERLMHQYASLSDGGRKQPIIQSLIRVRSAQFGGLIFYFLAVLTYLVCLPLFIFSVVWQERLLRFFTDGEDPNEQGQWLPWIVVGLVFGAAVVGKDHHTWHVYISHYVFRQGRKTKSGPITEAKNKAKSKGYNFASCLKRRTWKTEKRMSFEWRDLVAFCKHPFFLVLDIDRERTSDHPTVKFYIQADLPFPEKGWRHEESHYQGPWIKDDATWVKFATAIIIEADDRTLISWEDYKRRNPDKRIFYSISLPTVPTYPGQQSVVVNGDGITVEEKVVPGPNAQNNRPGLAQAIIPGIRKASTMSLALQPLLNSIARNNSLPSVHSLNGVGSSSLQNKGTFVTETLVPPSPLLSVDTRLDRNIPSVLVLQRQGTEPVVSGQGIASGGNQKN